MKGSRRSGRVGLSAPLSSSAGVGGGDMGTMGTIIQLRGPGRLDVILSLLHSRTSRAVRLL